MNKLTVTDSQTIQNKIYNIRGIQVMLDEDLALLYGVETKQLNKAVNRNIARFPEKFRFQLTQEDKQHGVRRYLPYVFTEQGVSMLSAILRSQTAIKVSNYWIKLLIATHYLNSDEIHTQSLLSEIEEISKLLTSIVKSAQGNI